MVENKGWKRAHGVYALGIALAAAPGLHTRGQDTDSFLSVLQTFSKSLGQVWSKCWLCTHTDNTTRTHLFPPKAPPNLLKELWWIIMTVITDYILKTGLKLETEYGCNVVLQYLLK